jgi:urease subunit gamma/beta
MGWAAPRPSAVATMPSMRLTAWEEERLLIFSAAELARRHRAAGLKLNHPEAVALICDAMLEAARADRTYAAVEQAGRSAVRAGDVLDGVAALVDEVRLEVLFGDGPRLVVLVDPLGAVADERSTPGAIQSHDTGPDDAPVGERRRLSVRNDSRRVIRVSSHYPFDRVNPRLAFDREAAVGFRLDLPAGSTERWAPGETREVGLVRYGGRQSKPASPE